MSARTGEAGTYQAMGITSRAAMMLCMALKQTFSRATAHRGSGHMTRSSISRVMPNSLESGSATAAIPENMMATAIKPGSRMVPKSAPPPTAMGLPLPMRGRMKVKTKRNSSGCIPTRRMKGRNSRVSTRRSRRKRPRKDLRKIAGERSILFTQVPPGEFDEDGFQARLGDLQVSQTMGGGGLNQIGEQTVRAGGGDPQTLSGDLGTGHVGTQVEAGHQQLHALLRFEFPVEDGVRAEGGLQLLRRAKGQHTAVVDDGQPVAERVCLFHVVRGQQDGNAFLVQLLHGRPHGHAALRVEAGGGLVEEEDGGVVGDGAGNLHPLRQAAGELRRIDALALGEHELAEQL